MKSFVTTMLILPRNEKPDIRTYSKTLLPEVTSLFKFILPYLAPLSGHSQFADSSQKYNGPI